MLVRPGKQVSGLLPRFSHVGRGNKGLRCIQGHIILLGGGVCVQSLQWVNSFLFKNFIQECHDHFQLKVVRVLNQGFTFQGWAGRCIEARDT